MDMTIQTNDDLEDFRTMVTAFSNVKCSWINEKRRYLQVGNAIACEVVAEGGLPGGIQLSWTGELDADLEDVILERYVDFRSTGLHRNR